MTAGDHLSYWDDGNEISFHIPVLPFAAVLAAAAGLLTSRE